VLSFVRDTDGAWRRIRIQDDSGLPQGPGGASGAS
jgi:hypothetical protein